MLKVRDGIMGNTVLITPVEPIPSGRYSLLKESNLGIHGIWPAGTLLVDDGRGCIDIDGETFQLESRKLDTKELAQRDIAFQALEEIQALAELRDVDSLPSPVIPPEIAHRFDHSQLEVELLEALQLGHLHSIAKSPRISMRYDEELLPVSRVKRTANNYQRHLAAHSECWQQRTFTGIIPKKLQAKISEDEVHIYENRVFSRLLDHLERYLIGTLARLRVLNEALQKGLDLEGSDSLHRSLRHALCETWGESFAQGEAESLKSLSEKKLGHFDDQLRKIQQLKQSATYRSIPRDAAVPLALKNTNILMNDPHYIKVRCLWESWVKEVALFSKDPVLVFEQQQKYIECYRHYIGLLILRAHMQIGWEITHLSDDKWELKHPSGVLGALNYRAGSWQVTLGGEDFFGRLEFIPVIDAFENEESITDRYVCRLIDLDETAEGVSCSPENLFSEESVIKVVQKWWLKSVVSEYGVEITGLPKVLEESWPSFQPTCRFKVHDYRSDQEFINWLKTSHLSSTVRSSIEKKRAAANFVAYCPCCGHKSEGAAFTSRDDRAFKSECNRCGADWKIRWTGGAWVFEIGEEDDAQRNGRWSCCIEV